MSELTAQQLRERSFQRELFEFELLQYLTRGILMKPRRGWTVNEHAIWDVLQRPPYAQTHGLDTSAGAIVGA